MCWAKKQHFHIKRPLLSPKVSFKAFPSFLRKIWALQKQVLMKFCHLLTNYCCSLTLELRLIFLARWERFLLIHLADPSTNITNVVRQSPLSKSIKTKQKSNEHSDRLCRTDGLAKGIIDDTCPLYTKIDMLLLPLFGTTGNFMSRFLTCILISDVVASIF